MRMDKRLFTLIKFIKENKDWENVLQHAPYFLKIRRHPSIENRFMFSYNQIYSEFHLDICKVSRGIILDIPTSPMQEIKVVARGFDKFHNYGETCADSIDWNGKIYAREKVDGSLIKCIVDEYDSTKLIWMTNNGFNADATLPEDLICEFDTFQDLINEALKDKDFISTNYYILQDYTLLFELVSPFNRIVCKYPQTDLILLGARNNAYGDEIMPETLQENISALKKFKIPKRYELSNKSIDEVLQIVAEFDANQEGLVIQDEHFNRIKIKSSQYLSVHRLKNNSGQLSSDHVLKCIQEETIDDVINFFPEYTQKIREIINQYKKIGKAIDDVIQNAKSYLDVVSKNADEKDRKKTYAMLVKDSLFSNIYFNLYKDFSKAEDYKQEYLKKLDFASFNSIHEKL
jgi:T4 RnlA family RNA ligase